MDPLEVFCFLAQFATPDHEIPATDNTKFQFQTKSPGKTAVFQSKPGEKRKVNLL